MPVDGERRGCHRGGVAELVGLNGRHGHGAAERVVPRVVTALICDSDPMRASLLHRLAQEGGFEVLPEATTAVEALDMAEHLSPHTVLMTHELLGMSGVEAAAEMRQRSDPPEVVLLTADVSLEDDPRAVGAFAVVDRNDIAAIEDAVDRVRHWLTSGERRTGSDRRTGEERRREQDWSKVHSERRGGEDRRKGPRRESDRQPGHEDSP
jgi:CheY-like chemotaxis protein